MHALVGDLEGIELVGDNVDAVLIGGADDSPETNLVFSYMNLARAFAELELGADLYCLHRNRWWQTAEGPRLDGGAFVAGLEYAAEVEATVLGDPTVWANGLKVVAQDGRVRIVGEVFTEEDREAVEQIVRAIEGVRHVENDLRVQPPPLTGM